MTKKLDLTAQPSRKTDHLGHSRASNGISWNDDSRAGLFAFGVSFGQLIMPGRSIKRKRKKRRI